LPRLSTIPRETGSSTATRTIGSDALARFAATVAGVPAVTKTAMPDPINSFVMAGSVSVRSSGPAVQNSNVLAIGPAETGEALAERIEKALVLLQRSWLNKPMRVISASTVAGFKGIAMAPANNSKSRRFI